MIDFLMMLQTRAEQMQWYNIMKRVAIYGLLILIAIIVALEFSDRRDLGGNSNYAMSQESKNFDAVIAIQESVLTMESDKSTAQLLKEIDEAMGDELAVSDAELVSITERYQSLEK